METTITKQTLEQINQNYLSMLEKLIMTRQSESILVIDAGECKTLYDEVIWDEQKKKVEENNKKIRAWTNQTIDKIVEIGNKTGAKCEIVTNQQTRQLKESYDKIQPNPSLTSMANNQTEKIPALYPHPMNFLVKDCLLCKSDFTEFIMEGLFQPKKVHLNGLPNTTEEPKHNYICSDKKIFEINDFGDGLFKPKYSLNKIFEGGEISRRKELDETEIIHLLMRGISTRHIDHRFNNQIEDVLSIYDEAKIKLTFLDSRKDVCYAEISDYHKDLHNVDYYVEEGYTSPNPFMVMGTVSIMDKFGDKKSEGWRISTKKLEKFTTGYLIWSPNKNIGENTLIQEHHSIKVYRPKDKIHAIDYETIRGKIHANSHYRDKETGLFFITYKSHVRSNPTYSMDGLEKFPMTGLETFLKEDNEHIYLMSRNEKGSESIGAKYEKKNMGLE